MDILNAWQAREAIRFAKEVQDKTRNDAVGQLEIESPYSDATVRQQIVHTREDICGVLVITPMIYAEVKIIRWICAVIALVLIYGQMK